jgi:organic hydroperoxide reductase OsmC/OhrA
MSTHISASFSAIDGTAAGLGRTNKKSLIADRPDGVARGSGLGFNGGELLASALGGCFWNDLHYVADAQGIVLSVDHVDAEIELAGNPPRVVRAHLTAQLSGPGSNKCQAVFDAACEVSTIANSLITAFPIQIELSDKGGT